MAANELLHGGVFVAPSLLLPLVLGSITGPSPAPQKGTSGTLVILQSPRPPALVPPAAAGEPLPRALSELIFLTHTGDLVMDVPVGGWPWRH